MEVLRNGMKIQTYTEKKPNKNGEKTVYLRISNNGKRILVSTGILCRKAPVGYTFPKSEKSSAAKTKNLIRIMSQCQEWIMEHPTATIDEAKVAFSEIATGRKIEPVTKFFIDYIQEFIDLKEKKSTKIVYRTKESSKPITLWTEALNQMAARNQIMRENPFIDRLMFMRTKRIE